MANIGAGIVFMRTTLQPRARFGLYISLETILRARIGRAAANAVDCAAARDGDEPAKRFAQRRRVTGRLAPHLQDAFLENVIGFRLVLQHLVNHLLQSLSVAL